MIMSRAAHRRIGYATVVVFSAMLPACSSPGGPQWPWLRGAVPPPDSTNVVYRPTYLPDTKPLFVGGYAGASYGPLFPRRALGPPEAPVVQDQPTVSVSHGSWDEE